MLALTKQIAKLEHINVRTERHGDKPTGAVDLRFVFTDSSALLSEFHPSLRHFLYKAEDVQQEIETGDEDTPTVRRFGDLIEGVILKSPMKGADVIIGFGLGGSSDIELSTANVGSPSVTVMEGGSCRYQVVIKATPTGDQVKKLFEVLGGEVDLSITPPGDDPQSSLDV